MDRETAQTNAALRTSIGAYLVQDQGLALRLRCVGSPESSSAYADAVLVSATSLTLSMNGVADSTVGTAGVLLFATYTTLGALVDAINASDNWEAELVGALRSDLTASSVLLARTTSTFRMFAEVAIYWDSSVYGFLTYLLEPGLAFDSVRKANSTRNPRGDAKLHRVGLYRIVCNDNNSAGAMTVVATELKLDKAATYKTLLSAAVADNTEKDTGAQTTPRFHAEYGNSILVKFGVSGDFTDTSCYLQVEGVRE